MQSNSATPSPLRNPTRRGFLAALTGTAIVAFTAQASAQDDVRHIEQVHTAGSRSYVREAMHGERGTTLLLSLRNAPFPAPNAGYKDDTVIVFVPSYFRAPRDGRISVLVHFHGHSSTAASAMQSHELREQFFDSKQNAILVIPQGPVNATDSSAGKLEAPGGLQRMLEDVLATLCTHDARMALHDSAIGRARHAAPRIGTVCLSSHSGGYHAAACCIRAGGVEINEVYLFDSLYADVDVFRDWVVAGKGRPARSRHKLVSYYTGGTTAAMSMQVKAALERSGVRCVAEAKEGTLSRAEITLAEAVFVQTGLNHHGVTYELNSLRDCLYASGMHRYLRSTWFDNKLDPRPLEHRQ